MSQPLDDSDGPEAKDGGSSRDLLRDHWVRAWAFAGDSASITNITTTMESLVALRAQRWPEAKKYDDAFLREVPVLQVL